MNAAHKTSPAKGILTNSRSLLKLQNSKSPLNISKERKGFSDYIRRGNLHFSGNEDIFPSAKSSCLKKMNTNYSNHSHHSQQVFESPGYFKNSGVSESKWNRNTFHFNTSDRKMLTKHSNPNFLPLNLLNRVHSSHFIQEKIQKESLRRNLISNANFPSPKQKLLLKNKYPQLPRTNSNIYTFKNTLHVFQK